MKIILLVFGKTNNKQLLILENEYIEKISRFVEIERVEIKEPTGHTKLNETEQMKREALMFETKFVSGDFLIVLDEKGKNCSSIEFSMFLQNKMNLSYKRLVFIIGGPYGVSDSLRKKANQVLSLSSMTYTHEMARMILLEQIYRGFNIINRSQYHHI